MVNASCTGPCSKACSGTLEETHPGSRLERHQRRQDAHRNIVEGDAGVGVLLEFGLVLHEVHLAAHASQGVEATATSALAALVTRPSASGGRLG